MKKLIAIFLLGIINGAISWGVVNLVSDRFEPFDSEIGFYTGQFILSIIALWVGYKMRFGFLIIYIIGAYLGMNAYSNIVGGPAQRVWWELAMITTTALVISPLVFGILGSIIYNVRKKFN